jgi:hypothetical protein
MPQVNTGSACLFVQIADVPKRRTTAERIVEMHGPTSRDHKDGVDAHLYDLLHDVVGNSHRATLDLLSKRALVNE